MGYRIWHKMYQDRLCAVGALEGVPGDEEIRRGVSRVDGFPADAYYEMRSDFPRNIKVSDNVYTMIHQVGSGRLRAVLEPELVRPVMDYHAINLLGDDGNDDLCMIADRPEGLGVYDFLTAMGRPAKDPMPNPAVLRMGADDA